MPGRHLVTGQWQAVQTLVMDGPISRHHAVRQSYDAVAKEYLDVGFRFFEPPDIANAMGRAGFRVEMRLERLSRPQEVQTRRAYLLARPQP